MVTATSQKENVRALLMGFSATTQRPLGGQRRPIPQHYAPLYYNTLRRQRSIPEAIEKYGQEKPRTLNKFRLGLGFLFGCLCVYSVQNVGLVYEEFDEFPGVANRESLALPGFGGTVEEMMSYGRTLFKIPYNTWQTIAYSGPSPTEAAAVIPAETIARLLLRWQVADTTTSDPVDSAHASHRLLPHSGPTVRPPANAGVVEVNARRSHIPALRSSKLGDDKGYPLEGRRVLGGNREGVVAPSKVVVVS
ncbi:hypothetical protein CYMTET_10668 [Cymbomonas tetramitiformis]|uniref:Uncharacterized protein n=1 Tax=Cymbomonas tetramitiformis TaxID=36881 RepID=A0AAE0GNZ3_9CHLO|nr:hypothetical protein CYMTET_10668 [Cymbomonas tetramitiformis]